MPEQYALEDLIELEKPAIKSHHLEFNYSLDKNIPKYLIGDKTKVHRILLNLIGNAIKFTEKGSIELAAHLISKNNKKVTIEFSVKDTGIGIPAAAQSQIFDRFYKLSPSYKGKYTGSGIGLHIVYKYIQLLGGKIKFKSIEGKGTTFFVSLSFPIDAKTNNEIKEKPSLEPQKQEEILTQEEIPNKLITPKVEHRENSLKILLVEDNILALKSLKLLLVPFKLDVVETENAEDALDLVRKQTFDLIITDIGLPKMQGDELVAKIRQLEKEEGRARGEIVALTGHAVDDEVLSANCKKAGIDVLFQKPMRPQILNDLIEPLIRKKSDVSNPTSPLGIDLPNTEEELFEIDHYPLLDLNLGVEILGSEEMLKDILKSLKNEAILPDLEKIKKAHLVGDWETVRALTHKMKGGATFGTVRLYYALLFLERYIKAGHSHCTEALFTQMLRVIDETLDSLNKSL